ncbi:DNA replication and repair protein RecF [Candidatus Acetothermia bacterium]|jgi:DNA replication and repair protein RecF|nr:DNA replication and repair protein RecF [Candidatus Acetothermia bacterium]MCI2431229.1 DNA replication and repair protein RecF [Candidatus Acetothermia bacterium]MCI2436842.1 DNA replication and repair protein RecF [Candidatus Acetothermia bacterium]
MKLDRIVLRHVRNLVSIDLAPDGGLNIIAGPNAAGKSNLCEAIYYAAKGWPLKGERQRDLISWDQSEALLEFSLSGDHIRLHLNGSARAKTIELNHEKKSQSELSALLRVLLFTPDELQVIKGSPEQRRRFLDRSIADLHRTYKHTLLEYEQILRRKSALLRSERPNMDLLDVYDEELSERGARLVAQRRSYLHKINEKLSQHYQQISDQTSQLRAHYETALSQNDDLQRDLAQLLAKARRAELRRRQALVGPQRDDLRFDLNEHDVKRFGSQGEQKSVLCALLLTQVELHYERFHDYPILILDDVLSELDRARTQRLLQLLPKNLQIFLTHTASTDEEMPSELRRGARRLYLITAGQITEKL